MLKNTLKNIMPASVMDCYYALLRRATRGRDASSSAAAEFSRVYRRGAWGAAEDGFFSGTGSTDAQTDDYIAFVAGFVKDHSITTVVDLGCGDFRVAGRLVGHLPESCRYIGIDVVPGLVERNQRLFASDRVSFMCADIAEQTLPEAELCLLRQVLQHLSNDEIARTLKGLRPFRYVLVTDHFPAPERLDRKNADIVHGAYTRVHDNSGIYLDAPPFSVQGVRQIHQTPALSPMVAEGETLQTWLIDRSA